MANILVLSPLASHPQNGGAKRRIYNLTQHLRAQGHRIHFVYTAHEAVDFKQVTRQMSGAWDTLDVIPFTGAYSKSCGEDFGVDDWFQPGSGEEVAALAARYEIDIALINYVFQSKYFEHLPDSVLKVLDVHDRLARRALFEQVGSTPGFFYTTEAEEQRGLARADIVLSIQDNEVPYFRDSGRPVTVIGHMTAKRFVDRRYGGLKKVGYLGANNKFNQYSLEMALPPLLEVLDALPSKPTLELAGNICNVIDIDHPRLRKLGFVRDESEFYASADLVINPTLVGTGLKIKTVEAMSYGVPLISTQTGYDGLKVEHPFHDCAGVPEMVEAVKAVARDPFGTLTALSNISRAVFSEYTVNLAGNLDAVFSEATIAAKRSGDLAARIDVATTMLGPAAEAGGRFVTLRQLSAAPKPVSIAHLVNPVILPKKSDLYIAQPVTFASMSAARKQAAPEVTVDLVAACYPEDTALIPEDFIAAPPLTTSVADVGTFELPRKLPLLRDLLERLASASDAEYLVFTNVDIALMPHFYTRVAELIQDGHDAIVINRRTISKRFSTVAELPQMYAEYGKDHPGYDCFVFSRRLLEKFDLDDICVGVHFIGRVLLWNLLGYARNFKLIEREHLTFHIGDDVPSKDVRQIDYVAHNTRAGLRALKTIDQDTGVIEKIADQAEWRLLSTNFGPGLFQTAAGDGFSAPRTLDQPIFIHALFRAGSTYIWRKLREKQNLCVFYEPLHEDLALFRASNLDEMRKRHAPAIFHKDRGDENWFFYEYEPLVRDGDAGIPEFNRKFSYDYYAKNDEGADLRAYIDALLETAAPKNPVLQFNRTSLRQEWFAREYPGCLQVYLYRGDFHQWMSAARFETARGIKGFLRNSLMISGKNKDAPLMAPLAQIVPLAATPNVTRMHQMYDKIYDAYALEEHFVISYYIWMMSLIEACKHADLIVDVDRLSRDRLYQMEMSFEFMLRNAPVEFLDAAVKFYDVAEGELTEGSMDALRGVVCALVAAHVPDAADALQTRGFGALAQRLRDADAASLAQVDRAAVAARAARLQALFDDTGRPVSLGGPDALLDDLPSLAGRQFAEVPGALDRHQVAKSAVPGPTLTPFELGTSIAVGEDDARLKLDGGWSFSERTHIWALGETASFFVALPKSDAARALVFTCSYSMEVEETGRRMSVEIDGAVCFPEQAIDVEDTRYVIPLPPNAEGTVHVVLRTVGAKTPSERDPRNLSVKMVRIELRA